MKLNDLNRLIKKNIVRLMIGVSCASLLLAGCDGDTAKVSDKQPASEARNSDDIDIDGDEDKIDEDGKIATGGNAVGITINDCYSDNRED